MTTLNRSFFSSEISTRMKREKGQKDVQMNLNKRFLFFISFEIHVYITALLVPL